MGNLIKSGGFKAYAALVVVYLVWGTTLAGMRFGIETIHPALLVCLRFSIAGIIILAACWIMGDRRIPTFAELKRNVIVGLLLFLGGNSIVSWAIQYMTTGLGAAIVATTPFWMLGFSQIIPPKEKVDPVALMGIVIGFAGMIILLSPQLSQPVSVSPIFWVSILAMLLNAGSWAAGSVFARKNPTATSLLMDVGLQNLAAGIALVPICFMTNAFDNFAPSATSLAALAYLIVFGTIVTVPCYLYVLRKLPVSVSSTFAYVTPVVTAIVGWLFLNEALTLPIIVGMGVILTGVIIVQTVNQRQQMAIRQAAASAA